jgi:hypothetical protein
MDETVTETELTPEPPHQTHPVDTISLAFGIIFVILGAVFLFGDIDASSIDIAWAWAGFLGAVGLLLLAIGFRRYRRLDAP